eukprot:CAMPEP_0203888998 /NCGR_PEP_ID=MMETSP0359-20131031/32595_1 /ASSEMBLY_ACC=CAM_ASM_000338 /TAXON_ID=268821 /ORGANISM="Scrippsiella Hangoei, Strain SHTV-5" /LENGTH=214 /DNA_ID=CAMNT_0050810315 /DNA_START=362 /DNA_END=1003 /DNA_ORIENTATION=-
MYWRRPVCERSASNNDMASPAATIRKLSGNTLKTCAIAAFAEASFPAVPRGGKFLPYPLAASRGSVSSEATSEKSMTATRSQVASRGWSSSMFGHWGRDSMYSAKPLRVSSPSGRLTKAAMQSMSARAAAASATDAQRAMLASESGASTLSAVRALFDAAISAPLAPSSWTPCSRASRGRCRGSSHIRHGTKVHMKIGIYALGNNGRSNPYKLE